MKQHLAKAVLLAAVVLGATSPLGGCSLFEAPLESGGDIGTGNVAEHTSGSLIVHSELVCGLYTLEGRHVANIANLHREIIDLPQSTLAPPTPGMINLTPGKYKLRVEEGSRRVEWTLTIAANRTTAVDVGKLLDDPKGK